MKSSFQTILTIVFIAGFVIAIAIFSGLFSSTSKKTSTVASGQVIVWGVLPPDIMDPFINNFNGNSHGYTIDYIYHDPANLYQDLITALADNKSPDLVIVSSETMAQIQDKLYVIPYAAYPERQFRDTNIDGAQIFLSSTGVTAMPLLVDPLVVYYNKDILASKNFVTLPKTWDDLLAATPVLTKKNKQNSITQSAIALGETDNINNARDILSALFLQTGNNIVSYDPTTDIGTVTLTNGQTDANTPLPAVQALSFYTSFSNPSSTNYTWNSGLPESLQNFLAGNSAFYIGRASELFTIQSQNPHLNFDVAPLFQSSTDARPITFGSFIAVSMLKNAPNPVAAYAAATELSSSTGIDALSKTFSLPPVRRDLLQVAQTNPYVSVFFQAALSTFSWLDPNPVTTNKIFHDMITNVNSNTTDVQTAITTAAKDLQSSIQ